MFKFMLKKLKKNNKGFTLVELVVVIAILGILAAIAVPKLTTSKKKAAIVAHNANVKTLMNAANLYYVEKNEKAEWTGDDNQEWENYIQEWPEIPDGLTKDDFEDLDPNQNSGNNKDLKYTVTIDNDGTITVTPGLIDEDANSDDSGGNN